MPERQRRRVLKRDPVCKLTITGVCIHRSTEVDHIRDAADDGPDTDDNLQGVCAECHLYKSARRSAARSRGGPNGSKVMREKERHPGVLP